MTEPWRPFNCAICAAPIGQNAPDMLCGECVDMLYDRGATHPPIISEDCRREIRAMVGEALSVSQRLAREREEEGPTEYIKVAASDIPCYVHPDDVVKVEVTNSKTGRSAVLIECTARHWPQFMVTWGYHVRMRLREQENAALTAGVASVAEHADPRLALVVQQAQAGLQRTAARMLGATLGMQLAERAMQLVTQSAAVTPPVTPPEDK